MNVRKARLKKSLYTRLPN